MLNNVTLIIYYNLKYSYLIVKPALFDRYRCAYKLYTLLYFTFLLKYKFVY